MREEIQNPYPDKACFLCGSENAQGLHLKVYWDRDTQEASTEYVPAPHFAGQGNILHGAIQTGLLDEIMGWTCYAVAQHLAVTSELTIKFMHPVYISGESVHVSCRVSAQDAPKVHLHATLSNAEGRVCTIATGAFHLLPPERYRKLIHG